MEKYILGVELEPNGSIKIVQMCVSKCICIKYNADPYTQLSTSIPKTDFNEGNIYYYGIDDTRPVTNPYFVVEEGKTHRYFTEDEFNAHFVDYIKNRENKISNIVDESLNNSSDCE
jgi:hypothetical protein